MSDMAASHTLCRRRWVAVGVLAATSLVLSSCFDATSKVAVSDVGTADVTVELRADTSGVTGSLVGGVADVADWVGFGVSSDDLDAFGDVGEWLDSSVCAAVAGFDPSWEVTSAALSADSKMVGVSCSVSEVPVAEVTSLFGFDVELSQTDGVTSFTMFDVTNPDRDGVTGASWLLERLTGRLEGAPGVSQVPDAVWSSPPAGWLGDRVEGALDVTVEVSAPGVLVSSTGDVEGSVLSFDVLELGAQDLVGVDGSPTSDLVAVWEPAGSSSWGAAQWVTFTLVSLVAAAVGWSLWTAPFRRRQRAVKAREQ